MVYGHVVASDVFGRGYVVPICDSFEDIKNRLSAQSVSLPSAAELATSNPHRSQQQAISTDDDRLALPPGQCAPVVNPSSEDAAPAYLPQEVDPEDVNSPQHDDPPEDDNPPPCVDPLQDFRTTQDINFLRDFNLTQDVKSPQNINSYQDFTLIHDIDPAFQAGNEPDASPTASPLVYAVQQLSVRQPSDLPGGHLDLRQQTHLPSQIELMKSSSTADVEENPDSGYSTMQNTPDPPPERLDFQQALGIWKRFPHTSPRKLKPY